jgi:hypothetical protein
MLYTFAFDMVEFIDDFEKLILHVYRDRNINITIELRQQHMISPEETAHPTMMMRRSDFASVIGIKVFFRCMLLYQALSCILHGSGVTAH